MNAGHTLPGAMPHAQYPAADERIPPVANRIHPTAVLGEGVELGEDNVIGPFAVIAGPVRIGDGNWIGPHVTIGTPGEDRHRPHPAAWDGGAGR